MSDSARQWLARADRAHRREDMQDFIERAAAGALVEIAETLERAMSEQRGLRNPDTHGTTSDGEPYCESCGVCDEGWRCRCCLAAEVEALRAQVQADEEAERSLRERYNDLLVDHGKLTAQVQALRAQVQRVRELHYNTATHHPSGCCSECGGTYPCPTVRAFDGGGGAA